ncbi:NADH-quinone oxidoreductase subunit NuoG [Gammaproteobacteria bacterium]|nr:NADH-quinone oxidoreductase subunit NuoG [Gammaproteobacteria bacterium]
MSNNKVNITINNVLHSVDEGTMLIEITDELGIYIPRFCYHEKLSIAANCRMCLVEVENSSHALPACATPVTDGMVVDTLSHSTKTAQQSTMEFLLINHPLDCPICDQGGECELQDLAYAYGKNNSRFDLQKLTKPNDDLGPLVSTDMTRCIMCTRCTRFGSEVAGIEELGTMGRGETSNISTYVKQTVNHELSGNIIDLCPVGALNNKPYRYTDRTWEMDQIQSVSPHDCVGTNLYMHVKNNKIKRVVPMQNESINETWIADRDRFGFDGIYSEDRLLTPLIRNNGTLIESTIEESRHQLNATISSLIQSNKTDNIAALISPSVSLNEQFIFSNYLSQLGIRNIDHRINQVDFSGDTLDPLFPHLNIKLNTIEKMETIFVIGSDLRRETPLISHWVKKAADKGASIHFMDIALREYHFPISDYIITDTQSLVENIGLVAKAASTIAQLDVPQHIQEQLDNLSEPSATHKQIAQSLFTKTNTLLLNGLVSRSHSDFSLIRSYINILASLTNSNLGELTSGANSVGAYITGCIPHRNLLGQSSQAGLNALEIASKNHDLIILYGLEIDDCLYNQMLAEALKGSKKVVVFNSFMESVINDHADIVIPINTIYESKGSFINLTGQVQNFNQELLLPNDYYSNEALLTDLVNERDLDIPSFNDFMKGLESFIDQSIANRNYIKEFPVKTSNPSPIDITNTFNMYSIDAILRRSKPLQQTKESKTIT